MTTHTCHARGCETSVPPRLWGCLRHWRMVPKPLQDDIWDTYRPGQEIDKQPSDAYREAAARAVAAVAIKEGR